MTQPQPCETFTQINRPFKGLVLTENLMETSQYSTGENILNICLKKIWRKKLILGKLLTFMKFFENIFS